MSYCVRCREITQDSNPRIMESRGGQPYVASGCGYCGCNKCRFVSRMEGSGRSRARPRGNGFLGGFSGGYRRRGGQFLMPY